EGFEYEDSLVIDSSKVEAGRKDLIVSYDGLQYKIPFFITKEEEAGIPVEFVEEFKRIDMDLLYNDTKIGYLKFQNVLNIPIYNLDFELTGNLYEIIKLKSERIKYLGAGRLGRVELIINEDKKEEPKDYSGDFIIRGIDFKVSMPINISVKYTPEEIVFEEPTFTPQPKKKDYTTVYVLLITAIFIIVVYLLIKLKLGKAKGKSFIEYVESLKK
ncbi:unnamed protein product, partial [marine sediment metagenome]